MQPIHFRHQRSKSLRGHLQATKADERGLTTLEWLLIVAAVAGLAALAVVLVQNVVSDTAEQIEGGSARKTAAQVAAAAIKQEARTADINDSRWAFWGDWVTYYTDKCNRLKITFSDAINEDDVEAEFAQTHGDDLDDPTTAAKLLAADDEPPASGAISAQAKCKVK